MSTTSEETWKHNQQLDNKQVKGKYYDKFSSKPKDDDTSSLSSIGSNSSVDVTRLTEDDCLVFLNFQVENLKTELVLINEELAVLTKQKDDVTEAQKMTRMVLDRLCYVINKRDSI